MWYSTKNTVSTPKTSNCSHLGHSRSKWFYISSKVPILLKKTDPPTQRYDRPEHIGLEAGSYKRNSMHIVFMRDIEHPVRLFKNLISKILSASGLFFNQTGVRRLTRAVRWRLFCGLYDGAAFACLMRCWQDMNTMCRRGISFNGVPLRFHVSKRAQTIPPRLTDRFLRQDSALAADVQNHFRRGTLRLAVWAPGAERFTTATSADTSARQHSTALSHASRLLRVKYLSYIVDGGLPTATMPLIARPFLVAFVQLRLATALPPKGCGWLRRQTRRRGFSTARRADLPDDVSATSLAR